MCKKIFLNADTRISNTDSRRFICVNPRSICENLRSLTFLILFSVICFLSSADAAVPHLINYQGRLTNAADTPVADGNYSVAFRIYDAESGGTLLWQGTHTITVSKGIFNVLLGDINDSGYNFANLAFDKQYYLAIKVGSDPEMAPRQRITSVGYAIRAEQSEQAQNATKLNNFEVNTIPQANKLLPLDSNAKLPLSALKIYDSGWFAVSINSNYPKTHNLGTTKVIYQLWFSPNSNGDPCYSIYGIVELDQDGRGNFRGGFVTTLTPTAITISTSGISGNGNYVWDGLKSNNVPGNYTSGYYRIILLALE